VGQAAVANTASAVKQKLSSSEEELSNHYQLNGRLEKHKVTNISNIVDSNYIPSFGTHYRTLLVLVLVL
jgi:hypothetical protein